MKLNKKCKECGECLSGYILRQYVEGSEPLSTSLKLFVINYGCENYKECPIYNK